MTNPITPTPAQLKELAETGRYVERVKCEPQPECCAIGLCPCWKLGEAIWFDDKRFPCNVNEGEFICDFSPFGATGETFWVRETYRVFLGSDCRIEFRSGGLAHEGDFDKCCEYNRLSIAQAKREMDSLDSPAGFKLSPDWQSPVTMPRSLSRYTLRQTVTLERDGDWYWVRKMEVVK